MQTAGWRCPIARRRVTALNHLQTYVSGDGLIRIVIARRDPGVANWLDTTERATGQLTFRWFWPRSDRDPSISTRVVAAASVADLVPADTPRLDAETRAADLALRRAHLNWRFRT